MTRGVAAPTPAWRARSPCTGNPPRSRLSLSAPARGFPAWRWSARLMNNTAGKGASHAGEDKAVVWDRAEGWGCVSVSKAEASGA